MKFKRGLWLMQKDIKPLYAVEAYRTRERDGTVEVLAATAHIANRGATMSPALNVPAGASVMCHTSDSRLSSKACVTSKTPLSDATVPISDGWPPPSGKKTDESQTMASKPSLSCTSVTIAVLEAAY